MPPRRRSRRAPSGANVALRWNGLANSCAPELSGELMDSMGAAAEETVRLCSYAHWRGRGAPPENRHHAIGEELLRLDGFPVFESAKIGDDSQFTDSTFLF